MREETPFPGPQAYRFIGNFGVFFMFKLPILWASLGFLLFGICAKASLVSSQQLAVLLELIDNAETRIELANDPDFEPLLIYANVLSEDVRVPAITQQFVTPDTTRKMDPFALLSLPQVRDFDDWCRWAVNVEAEVFSDLPPIWVSSETPHEIDVEDCLMDYAALALEERPFILWPIGTHSGLLGDVTIWMAFDREALGNTQARRYIRWMIAGPGPNKEEENKEAESKEADGNEGYQGAISFFWAK